MRIVRTAFFLTQLKQVLRYIALDNPPAALSFERALSAKVEVLLAQSYACRASHYMQGEAYRDLIHQGYTVIYQIEKEALVLLDIFKWQARESHLNLCE
jgi:plasmid stabilization system protein ParE